MTVSKLLLQEGSQNNDAGQYKAQVGEGLLQENVVSTALLASIPIAAIQPILTQNQQKNRKILSHTV